MKTEIRLKNGEVVKLKKDTLSSADVKYLVDKSLEVFIDDEDKDLQEIYTRYSAFLNKYGLFDPAWERPPFKKNGNHYFLFFPEILSDWEEYKPILESASDFITVISVPKTGLNIKNNMSALAQAKILKINCLKDNPKNIFSE